MRSRLFTCAALLAGAASPVAAQRATVSALASTLGLGGEVEFRPSASVGLRAGYLQFGLSRVDQVEGIQYDLRPQLQNVQLGLDLHPFGNGLRLSGGLLYARSHADGVAILTGPVDVGGTTYQPSEVGSLVGELRYRRRWMPWAGFGVAGGGRVSVSFDVGIVAAGHPEVALRSEGGSLSGPEQVVLNQNIAAEQAEVQRAIDAEPLAKYLPIVSLGLRFRL